MNVLNYLSTQFDTFLIHRDQFLYAYLEGLFDHLPRPTSKQLSLTTTSVVKRC